VNCVAEKQNVKQAVVKPRELLIAPRALDQLDKIEIDLEEARSGRADKFFAKLDKLGKNLVAFPEIGVAKEALGPGIRSCVIWDYLILYQVTDEHIRVEAVFHGAQDIETLFLKE
jgi:toxin ParE1/3/4